MRKANVLFLVLTVSMIVFCGISYAAVAGFINAATPAAPEANRAAVEGAVRDAANEGKPFASNAALLTTDLIDNLKGDATAVVTLNGQAIAVPGVVDQKAYAIGLGSVRMAKVAVNGNAYDFTDTTISPLLFTDKYVLDSTDAFVATASNIDPNTQIAVIIAMENNPEDIAKNIKIKALIEAGKVVIVSTSGDSRNAFVQLFQDNPQGFNLRDVNRTNSALVAKALQGAV